LLVMGFADAPLLLLNLKTKSSQVVLLEWVVMLMKSHAPLVVVKVNLLHQFQK